MRLAAPQMYRTGAGRPLPPHHEPRPAFEKLGSGSSGRMAQLPQIGIAFGAVLSPARCPEARLSLREECPSEQIWRRRGLVRTEALAQHHSRAVSSPLQTRSRGQLTPPTRGAEGNCVNGPPAIPKGQGWGWKRQRASREPLT